jgi:hypothetical protein
MHLAGSGKQRCGIVSAVRELHFPLKKGKAIVTLWVRCPLSLRSSSWPPQSSLALSHHFPNLSHFTLPAQGHCRPATHSCRKLPGLLVLRNFSDEDDLRPSGLAVFGNCVFDHRMAHVKLASRWRYKQNIPPTHDTPIRLNGVVDQQATPWIFLCCRLLLCHFSSYHCMLYNRNCSIFYFVALITDIQMSPLFSLPYSPFILCVCLSSSSSHRTFSLAVHSQNL